MSEEELTIANASDQEKSEAYGLLSLRENELSGIRDGLVRPKRILRRATKKTESRAFQMYMRLFWRRPKKYNVCFFFKCIYSFLNMFVTLNQCHSLTG